MGITDARGLTAEQRAARKTMIDELTAEARANWKDPAWHAAMAETITQQIEYGFEMDNILDLMTTVDRVDLNGRITVKETRGLRAFWVARGGYIEASNLRSEVTELQSRTIGFHVYENEDKLEVGFGETQVELISAGSRRMSAEVNLNVLRTFEAAMPEGGDYTVAGPGIDISVLDTAINEVIEESLDDTPTIIGRRGVIGDLVNQIADGSLFTPETNEQVRRTGVLGEYHGARFVYLKNYKDDENVSFFPGNEVFVLGRDASKAGFWGGLKSKEWTTPDWVWHYAARQDFGVLVHRPERARRLIDTARDA